MKSHCAINNNEICIQWSHIKQCHLLDFYLRKTIKKINKTCYSALQIIKLKNGAVMCF